MLIEGNTIPVIKDFKDKGLSDGRAMIQVCAAIEPRCINWDLVLPGDNDEEKMNNAKYGISCARKLGAVIFCIWEDLVEVNPKQNLICYATLMDLQKKLADEKK
jgi:plastin-1